MWQVKHAPRAAMPWWNEPDHRCATSSGRRVLRSFRCKGAPLPCYATHTQSNASTSGFSRDVRTQPNATFFFAQAKSRGKTAAFRVMILDHEDQT